MSGDHDAPRDQRLLAALRHAPDRDAVPPAALDRAILDQAHRSAMREPGASVWRRAWIALQQALLGLTRPAAGAALASLVLATTITLLWRDGPPPESARELPSTRGPAPASAEPASAAAQRDLAANAESALTRTTETAKGGAAGRAATAPSPVAAAAPPLPPARAALAAKSAPAAPVPAPAPPAAPPAPRAADAAPEAPAADAAPLAAAQPAPSAAAGHLVLPGTPAAALEQRQDARALRPMLAARSRASGVGAPPPELLRAMAEPGPVQQALRELAQRPDSAEAWSAGWAPSPLGPAPGDMLLRSPDGAVIGRLRIHEGALLWVGTAGAARLALDPAALAALRGALGSEQGSPPR